MGNRDSDGNSGWRLSKTIRRTRGCHIEAERRLLTRTALTSHANLYYGCWSAVLTLLTLDQRYASLTLTAACFATTVALWAAYASAEHYELRARDFYSSYLELQKLWTECEAVEEIAMEDPNRKSAIEDVCVRYCGVLASTENHTKEDYIKYLYSEQNKGFSGDEETQMSGSQAILLRWYWVSYVLQRVMVYVVVPTVLLYVPTIADWLS